MTESSTVPGARPATTDPAAPGESTVAAAVPPPEPPFSMRRLFGVRGNAGMSLTRAIRLLAFIVVEIAVAIGIWQLIVSVMHTDIDVLPGPAPVWDALRSLLSSPSLWKAAWVTLEETLLGFAFGALAGIVVAIVLDQSKWLARILNPYIVAFQAIPKIAIAPLFLIWFGFGISSKVVLISTLVFFPVLINMVSGLRSTSAEQEELMLVYRASRLDQFRHLRFYASLPYLIAAFEVCLTLSPTAAVFAEILGSGSSTGLGTLIQLYSSQINMGALFAIVVVLTILGVLLNGVVVLMRRTLVRWNPGGGR
jgi:NitT/TauT family transport system permease protein